MPEILGQALRRGRGHYIATHGQKRFPGAVVMTENTRKKQQTGREKITNICGFFCIMLTWFVIAMTFKDIIKYFLN